MLLALLVGISVIAIPLRRDPLFPFQPIPSPSRPGSLSGIPAFILSLAPNNEQAIRTSFGEL